MEIKSTILGSFVALLTAAILQFSLQGRLDTIILGTQPFFCMLRAMRNQNRWMMFNMSAPYYLTLALYGFVHSMVDITVEQAFGLAYLVFIIFAIKELLWSKKSGSKLP